MGLLCGPYLHNARDNEKKSRFECESEPVLEFESNFLKHNKSGHQFNDANNSYNLMKRIFQRNSFTRIHCVSDLDELCEACDRLAQRWQWFALVFGVQRWFECFPVQ